MKIKPPEIMIALFCALIIMYSCNYSTQVIIKPIDQELNQQFLTGERLDKNYFSTQDVVQYYVVSGYENLPEKQILTELNSYITAHYQVNTMDSLQQLNLLFYKKRMFVNYSDYLYESARDNETRVIEGHSDDLVARIQYERTRSDTRKTVHTQCLYVGKQKPFVLTDTLYLR